MSGCADTNFTNIIYTKLPALLSMKKSIYEHLFLILAGICLNQRTGIANIRFQTLFYGIIEIYTLVLPRKSLLWSA